MQELVRRLSIYLVGLLLLGLLGSCKKDAIADDAIDTLSAQNLAKDPDFVAYVLLQNRLLEQSPVFNNTYAAAEQATYWAKLKEVLTYPQSGGPTSEVSEQRALLLGFPSIAPTSEFYQNKRQHLQRLYAKYPTLKEPRSTQVTELVVRALAMTTNQVPWTLYYDRRTDALRSGSRTDLLADSTIPVTLPDGEAASCCDKAIFYLYSSLNGALSDFYLNGMVSEEPVDDLSAIDALMTDAVSIGAAYRDKRSECHDSCN